MEVLILLGMTSTFAWYYLIVIGFPGFFPAEGSPFVKRLVQLASFLGMIAGALFAIRNPRDFSKHAYSQVKTIIWGVVGCLVPALVMLEHFGIALPIPAIWLIVAATGFGAGYFFTGWEDLSSNGRLSDTLISIGSAMIIALGLFLLVSLTMTALAQGIMGMLFIVLASVLFYGVSKRRIPKKKNAKDDAKKKESKAQKASEATAAASAGDEDEDEQRHSFNTKLSALLLFVNVPLGYALPGVYTLSSLLFFVTIAVALVALIAFVVFVRLIKKDLTFVMLLRCAIGASAIALLVAGINSDLLIVTCIILFAVWLVLRLAHAETLIRLTRVQKLTPVYLNVRGKLPGYIGFALGFAISMFIVGYASSASGFVIGGLVIVGVLFVAALALFPYSENYSKQLAVVPVVIDPNITSAEDIERAKCAELAKRYNLSPREEEILFFIVRGRNARYIAEKLVISESTAKTHIHNIYKKSGIHSQQKFIDIMDELV